MPRAEDYKKLEWELTSRGSYFARSELTKYYIYASQKNPIIGWMAFSTGPCEAYFELGWAPTLELIQEHVENIRKFLFGVGKDEDTICSKP